jgi:2-polyprenyl-6-methoxyphenol hydroxylase-like FAD-dependent oxidoreductase
MTLATISRYERTRVSSSGERAVVVGGSIAGLCAARVLADGFETVTVIEKDPLPDEPEPRRGVPQGPQIHALQEAGRATLEDLLPGFGEDVISAGGLMIDGASDIEFYDEGDFLADGPRRFPVYSASRPLFEHVIRRRVADLPGVRLRSGCQFVNYLAAADSTTVTGVEIRNRNAGHEKVEADLVVDAMGRVSRTPAWLEEQGYMPPAVDEVNIDIAYSTIAIERPANDRRAILVPASHPHTRGGAVFPIEGDRWLVNLHGIHGDHPPTDIEGFEDYAASLPVSDLKRLLDTYPRISEEVEYYPFPSNQRRYYEELEQFPEGLLVLGDAIASFNPIYGQGMSVAALEALALHHALGSGGREDLASRYFDRASEVIDIAWMMAVGADFQFPQTAGPKPRGTDLFGRYLSRLTRKAHIDSELRDVLFRVILMEQPPSVLLRPRIVATVLKPSRPELSVDFSTPSKKTSEGSRSTDSPTNTGSSSPEKGRGN